VGPLVASREPGLRLRGSPAGFLSIPLEVEFSVPDCRPEERYDVVVVGGGSGGVGAAVGAAHRSV
jgi:hypothetical protein